VCQDSKCCLLVNGVSRQQLLVLLSTSTDGTDSAKRASNAHSLRCISYRRAVISTKKQHHVDIRSSHLKLRLTALQISDKSFATFSCHNNADHICQLHNQLATRRNRNSYQLGAFASTAHLQCTQLLQFSSQKELNSSLPYRQQGQQGMQELHQYQLQL
jgi:hypothetical protein